MFSIFEPFADKWRCTPLDEHDNKATISIERADAPQLLPSAWPSQTAEKLRNTPPTFGDEVTTSSRLCATLLSVYVIRAQSGASTIQRLASPSSSAPTRVSANDKKKKDLRRFQNFRYKNAQYTGRRRRSYAARDDQKGSIRKKKTIVTLVY